MKSITLRVRPSLRSLQNHYEKGTKKPLEDLMRAWKGIKELPPENLMSFFALGGFHGQPFRGAGWGSTAYWGGYCNHGNVLFPTWHRVYLVKLEEALRNINGCENVMMPFWDETSRDTITNGIPWALTNEKFVLDGIEIDNPLRSFIFPLNVHDTVQSDNNQYTKPKGYETVRYPLSGLVGTAEDRAATEAHNADYKDPAYRVQLLNDNVKTWMSTNVIINGKPVKNLGYVTQKFKDCLKAPNYTIFSNTTSAQEWNFNLEDGSKPIVPLESPHNSVHLAVGGFDVPGADLSPIDGANGDMGENNTAGLDPIFFFHHCNVDRMFWLWQKQNGYTDNLDIISGYPGTNSVDSQGPTPGITPNSWLTLDTPLSPFKLNDNCQEREYTSNDCINIETQLGFTYSSGSLDDQDSNAKKNLRLEAASAKKGKMIRVSRINRAPIRGSFLISAFATIDDKKQLLGTEAVLSRWNTQHCANCQTHLEVRAHFGLHDFQDKINENTPIHIEIKGRDSKLTDEKSKQFGIQNFVQKSFLVSTIQEEVLDSNNKKLFNVEIR